MVLVAKTYFVVNNVPVAQRLLYSVVDGEERLGIGEGEPCTASACPKEVGVACSFKTLVDEQGGFGVGGNLQAYGLLQEIAGLCDALCLPYALHALECHFHGRKGTRHQEAVRIVACALGGRLLHVYGLRPLAVIKVCLGPSQRVACGLDGFGRSGCVITAHTSRMAGRIGFVLDTFPCGIGVGLRFLVGVPLHEEPHPPAGHLCYGSLVGKEPYDGSQYVFSLVEIGTQVDGLIAPVAHVSPAGAQRHQ